MLMLSQSKTVCEMGQRNPPMSSIGGFTLFPGQEHIENSGFHLWKAAVEKNLKEALDLSRTFLPFSFTHILPDA